MRDSSIFYRSFYEAIDELPDVNKLEVYTAIFEYSFNFNEIELNGLSKTIFTLIKPQLEANNKRFANGNKPKIKQEKSKTEAKTKQKISKDQANNNNNVNNNVNQNNNINNNYGKNSNIFLSESEYLKLCQDFSKDKADKAIDYLSDWGLEKPKQFKEYKNHNLTLRRWVFEAIEKKQFNKQSEIYSEIDKKVQSSLDMIKRGDRTNKEHNEVIRDNKYDSKYLLPE
jgi:hypothetical protein